MCAPPWPLSWRHRPLWDRRPAAQWARSWINTVAVGDVAGQAHQVMANLN